MEICNYKQQSPLHFAAFKHKLEAVNVLLNFGASPLVLDRKGRTPADDTDDEEIRTIIRLAQNNYVEAGIQ
jgi:ankyrin repeat protein